jgi:hypothetical protein
MARSVVALLADGVKQEINEVSGKGRKMRSRKNFKPPEFLPPASAFVRAHLRLNFFLN